MVTAIVIIVLLALLLLGLFAFQKARKNAELQQRRSELKDRFGPEYERYLSGSDNRAKAERKLAAIADRRDKLSIRDLTNEEKARYGTRWSAAQARFVDEPPAAVDDADTLITQVMKERGYPMDDFGARSDMIMVDHPEIVQYYRSAHESHERHRASGKLETEDLRQAFMHYRKLFHALVGTPEPVQTTRPLPAGKHSGAPGRPETPRDTQPMTSGPRDSRESRDTRVPGARSGELDREDDGRRTPVTDRRPPVDPTRSGPVQDRVVAGRADDAPATGRSPQETR
ncbi:hypothetical protein KIH74_00980 [Kineosporia sp. J2-2]|uniref:Secreted protein n=1 Tax=Kineosporia corallincola TaxID=2835133 RepID=A0ABS5T8U5_9ACTN|nr:hypothetical protein [Kineosporia corallincola]MBT0767475.1 hypothetical protein [Kineosporia corallincola]